MRKSEALSAAMAYAIKSIAADTSLNWVDRTALPMGAKGVILRDPYRRACRGGVLRRSGWHVAETTPFMFTVMLV